MVTNQTSKPKSKTKPYHHGDLRQKILSAACLLLETNNIASLSLRAVAKQVGVSHTAPYRHYKDKESLLVDIAKQGFDELAKDLQAAVQKYPNKPIEQLKEAGLRYVSLSIKHPQCTQLMFGGHLPSDNTYPGLKISADSAFNGLKFIIESGQKQGVFLEGDIETISLAAWAGIHGLTMLLISKRLPDILKIDSSTPHITEAVTATLLSGLQSR